MVIYATTTTLLCCDQPLSKPSIVQRQAYDDHDKYEEAREEAREEAAHRHDLPARHQGFVTSFCSVSGYLIIVFFRVWYASAITTEKCY
jgi:hypothetical protein